MHFTAKNGKANFWKGGIALNLNQMELQNLRHFIGEVELSARKYDFYAQQCSNPQIKSYFQQAAQKSQQSLQQLTNYLS